MKTVGILALQGSFAEHGKVFDRMGQDFVWVRSLDDLRGLTHLIIPGGESTTLTLLLKAYGMWEEIVRKIQEDYLNIFGTCAGAILCSRWGMDIEVERNGYGAQQDSAVMTLDSKVFSDLAGVFIRAPKLRTNREQRTENKKQGAKSAEGRHCEEQSNLEECLILAHFKDEPVLIEQGSFLVASFHPELTDDTRVHAYFLEK